MKYMITRQGLVGELYLNARLDGWTLNKKRAMRLDKISAQKLARQFGGSARAVPEPSGGAKTRAAMPAYNVGGEPCVAMAEAARRLGVSREWVRRLVGAGRLPSYRLEQGVVLVPLGAVIGWIRAPGGRRRKQSPIGGRPRAEGN